MLVSAPKASVAPPNQYFACYGTCYKQRSNAVSMFCFANAAHKPRVSDGAVGNTLISGHTATADFTARWSRVLSFPSFRRAPPATPSPQMEATRKRIVYRRLSCRVMQNAGATRHVAFVLLACLWASFCCKFARLFSSRRRSFRSFDSLGRGGGGERGEERQSVDGCSASCF